MFPFRIDGEVESTMSLPLSKKEKSCSVPVVFLLLLNLITVVQMKVINGTSMELEDSDSGFSWDIATDNPDLYDVLPMLDIESIIEELAETDRKYNSVTQTRRKRAPFASNYGKRIHERIEALETQNKPFSAAVRVSNKCTGSLISDRHVLTAAHCVHNRKRWKYKLPLLKVGFLQRSGKFHWIKVTKMFVPEAWKKLKSKVRGTKSVIDSDFAVLRLKRPHGRSYFTPQRSSYYFKSPMMFNGFPVDKGGKNIWHSSCRVQKLLGDILLSTCSASEGSSGSGVYVSRGQGGYAVTGIVSALLKVQNGKHIKLFTIVTKLTSAKTKLICHWIGSRCK